MPAITAIIPTHNRASWLRESVESVLNQSYQDFELVVVDDGSTDQTPEILSAYAQQCQVLTHSQNQGVSAARNTAIRQTDSDWVAFLDSDDQWLPQKLERQMQMIGMNPEICVNFTDEIWIRNGKRVNPKKKHEKKQGWIFQPSLSLCLMAPSTILIRRDVLEVTGLFDETLPVCEDYDLWLKITARFPVHLLNEKLMIRHGGHEDQLSSRMWGNDRFRVQSLQAILHHVPLSSDDRIKATEKLIEKCKILIIGFEKRKNLEQIAHYQNIIESHQGNL